MRRDDTEGSAPTFVDGGVTLALCGQKQSPLRTALVGRPPSGATTTANQSASNDHVHRYKARTKEDRRTSALSRQASSGVLP